MSMRWGILLACVVMVGAASSHVDAETSGSESGGKVGSNQGLTLEDVGRGLKSAAKNIEQEIPKLGSAIGSAVKKITEKEPSKSPEDKQGKSTKPTN